MRRDLLHPDDGEVGEATTPPPLSFGDQIRAQREEQARLRLEADVRNAARELGLSRGLARWLRWVW